MSGETIAICVILFILIAALWVSFHHMPAHPVVVVVQAPKVAPPVPAPAPGSAAPAAPPVADVKKEHLDPY